MMTDEEISKLRAEAIEKLAMLQGNCTEFAHREADRILSDLLVDLGFLDVIEAYDKIDKWYE